MQLAADSALRRNVCFTPTFCRKPDESFREQECQKQPRCHSFDHFVGGREQVVRHGEAERPGSLEVEDQLELGRRLNRQVGRLLALEDAIDAAGRLPVLVDVIRPIGDQATVGGEGTFEVDRRQLVPRRQDDDQLTMNRQPPGSTTRSDRHSGSPQML